MYAIIEVGGRQWKVEPGTRLEVNRLSEEVGATHTVDRVLLASDGQRAQVGRPFVSGASVTCEVLEHRRGPKVISYYFRRRENWRKTIGHRQSLTRLLVKDILVGGVSGAREDAAAAAKPRAAKPRAGKATAKARPKTARSRRQ